MDLSVRSVSDSDTWRILLCYEVLAPSQISSLAGSRGLATKRGQPTDIVTVVNEEPLIRLLGFKFTHSCQSPGLWSMCNRLF